ncbi:aminopeptidase [Stutzerimonas azotifigens]|uniref:aminopeptidase n=1 Tax=Stutzerimonas azotifigens TaxID=291995 RepID=UPI0004230C47|nr:aminopeptidase [Stutzerimonas azotifigens]
MPLRKTATLDNVGYRWVPLLLVLLLGGCSYYRQLALGQLDLLARREPIAHILADPARDPQLRARLAGALEARRFASEALGLPDNDSYRLYVELDRPYVVWNLFATEAFSVEPLMHCFPIAGCVAYRGYYRQGDARGAAALLSLQGKDTFVAGVDAYSTLGWFDDPLPSSLLRHDDERLAALIFHELAHQRLYLPGDTAFNESYASFVEREGLRQWCAQRGLPAVSTEREQRYRRFVELVLETRERLRTLYASALPDEVMARRKQAEFDRLRANYRALRDGAWQGDGRFDGWFARPLNNASLVPFGLYDQWVPAFEALFEAVGGDWARFHAEVAALAKRPADERAARLTAGLEAAAQR